jgi:tRNA threonylcarbamoyladenosine biosynthesis protein TsaE
LPIISSNSEEETKAAARSVASQSMAGDIFLLKGDLGAGKSVFARSFIQTLLNNTNMDVPSPTFTLVQQYDTDKAPVWHFDLYRLEDPEEIYETGWEEAVTGDNILLVEWPERLGFLTPTRYKEIEINIINKTARHIHMRDVE